MSQHDLQHMQACEVVADASSHHNAIVSESEAEYRYTVLDEVSRAVASGTQPIYRAPRVGARGGRETADRRAEATQADITAISHELLKERTRATLTSTSTKRNPKKEERETS